MKEAKQFNNITDRIADDLRTSLNSSSRLSIAAATFSIYAYEALKEELEKIDDLRFIFTSQAFNAEKTPKEKREFFIPRRDRERALYGTEFEVRLRNQLTQKAIAKECAQWIRSKVRFKTNVSENQMPSFMNVREGDETYTYLPFNEFSTTELGIEKSSSLMNIKVGMPGAIQTDAMLRRFNELWADPEKFEDVTETVLDNIENVYKENSPDFIYFVTLYNIFNEFLEELSEDVLPNEGTGFKNSVIWSKLYNFQRDAALAIINKLEKYNGCILADSVGLGKTFTSLAVIKYYEVRNKSVLVLCPKKLSDNWMGFKANYKNNPVLADRFRYDVLFHSDLSRDYGKSNGLDLSALNWGNYDLIVIDESHNFRNGGKFDYEEEFEEHDLKENRYAKLMNKVIRDGIKTKVLMLSATPVNNRFNDLKNQLQLAYEGDVANINGKLGTEGDIDDIFRNAQAAYNKWSSLEPEERTTEALLESLSVDFFKVLDAVTIARSRNHIVKYYDTKDIGKFPKRNKPDSKAPKLTDIEGAITFTEIANTLNQLNLAIYTPSIYIQPTAKEKYEVDYGDVSNLNLLARERGLRKLMAINLLKRLESSVYSFSLTLTRIKELIESSIAAVDNFIKNGAGEIDVTDAAIDLESEDENDAIVGKKSRINIKDMDYLSWKRDLEADHHELVALLTLLKVIDVDHDAKLQQLYADIKNKIAHPFNEGNKKVLIFTAFADTADYLFESLADKLNKECGVHVALVTGSTNGKTTIPRFKMDFNRALTCFSPISKDRDILEKDPKQRYDIDILIATDCISEGQNLQDCDTLINYDIHWNPVRIIQRFGRIDRIGSRNDVIQLINYWPDMELDEYIQLKGRVESRMKATILTASGDENPLSDAEKGDLEYRRKQLKKLQEDVVDLEEMDAGVNIMDLGLTEFQSDLLAYMKDHPNMDLTPFGMSAVVPSDEVVKPGVIYVLKNRTTDVNIDKKNRLHPFYMVYVSHEGEVLCDYLSPKKLLDLMRHACKGHTVPYKELCKIFNKETKDGRKMDHYSELLQVSIESIIDVKQESDMDSLFSSGNSSFLDSGIKGLDDFELICFLVVAK